MTRDRLLEQAIELLAIADFHSLTLKEERNQVVREGIELLRQPKQEPVCPDCKAKVLYECVACSSNNYPQPEQAPYSVQQAYAMAQVCLDLHEAIGCKWGDNPYLTISQLKASQPQRKPLTDEQIESLLMNWPEDGIAFFEFARAIEAAHGIRENT